MKIVIEKPHVLEREAQFGERSAVGIFSTTTMSMSASSHASHAELDVRSSESCLRFCQYPEIKVRHGRVTPDERSGADRP
jgi:hypothetical protein